MTEPSDRRPEPAPGDESSWERPWVQLKTFVSRPNVFRTMVGRVSPDARIGDVVAVRDKDGRAIGHGFWNPGAPIALRVIKHTPGKPDDAWFEAALRRAVALRREVLGLDAAGDAYRLVNADGDGLSGLVVDRLGDTLAVEVSSYAVHRRLPRWLAILHEAAGTRREVVQVDEHVARLEGIPSHEIPRSAVRDAKVTEHGMRLEVNFADGHKTGFFCDQRENRRRFAELAKGRRVVDLCCYSGGFSVAAKLGGATEVTGVDLDEKAVAMAKRNANLNQARVDFVHADAFSWVRQMQRNGATWDLVLCDPPKFVEGRDPNDMADGLKKYNDLNVLALQLVAPGGFFVTCSCSGLVTEAQFEELVCKAAHRYGKRLQILARTGAGPDHPTASHHPEGRYLKVLWTRLL
ncbi:MAG: class I SAM-dependent rRNA methyltransferase [Opitutia bacterium]